MAGTGTFSSGASTKGTGTFSASPSQGSGGFNPIMGLLRALDVGRRGVVAGFKELDDLIVTPYERRKGDVPGSASLADIPKNFREDIGAGDLTYLGEDNKWLGRAIGFAGDVALDPLSYLTLGASKATTLAGRTLSKDDVARQLLRQAAEEGDDSLAELASRVARQGTGSLSAQEAERIGIRQGARFGIGEAKVSLPGTGTFARTVNAATAPVKGLAHSDHVYRILESIDPQNKLSRTGLPRAEQFTDEGPLKRLVLMDVKRLAKGEARGMGSAARQELNDLIPKLKNADLEDVRRILQGAAPTSPEAQEAATGLRSVMDRVRAETSALVGREIAELEDYLPVRFSDDLKKLLDERGPSRRVGAPASVKQREVFKPGGKFLGVELRGPKNIDDWKDAEELAREKFGDDAVELFEKNPAKLVDRYVSAMERYAAQEGVARRLGAAGIDPTYTEDVAKHTQVKNLQRLEELEDGAKPSHVAEHALRRDADELYEVANLHALEGDHQAAAHAALEASALHEAADLPPMAVEDLKLADVPVTDLALAALRMIPGDLDWTTRTLKALADQDAFVDKGWFLKVWDKATNAWKALALLSPGFHSRNLMGGVFNNSLAGVDPSIYGRFAANWKRLSSKGLDGVDEELRPFFAEMEKFGFRGAEVGRDFGDLAGNEVSKLTGNRLFKFNRRQAERVEYFLRGSLFVDQRLKGVSVDGALDAIAKYQFMYDETSPFFQQGIKRAVPFATWSRFNFPLQVEGMICKPGRFTRYTHAMRALEDAAEDDLGPEEDRPGWLNALMAIRSPWLAPGGRPLFLTPDLPFRDMAETFDVEKIQSQLHPFIKAPLETQRGRTFFSDNYLSGEAKEAPKGWGAVLAALWVFGGKFGLPKVKKDSEGWLISEKDANKIETFVPVLGRLKRLYPSDEKSQAKAFSAWLSFLGGMSTQTVAEQESTIKKAYQAFTSAADCQQLPKLKIRPAAELPRATYGMKRVRSTKGATPSDRKLSVAEAYDQAKAELLDSRSL